MRKTIGKKIYDTDTAKKVYEWETANLKEKLFLKKTGEYFILRKIMTSIQKADFEDIIPLKLEEAEQWGKEHMPEALQTDEFGFNANDEKVVTSFSLTRGNVAKGKKIASDKGTTLSFLIDDFLQKL